jgi:hypothetical protein
MGFVPGPGCSRRARPRSTTRVFAAQLESVGYKKRLDAPLLQSALAAVADGDMITTIASMAATVPMILRTGFPPGGRGSRAEVFAAHGCSGLDAGT